MVVATRDTATSAPRKPLRSPSGSSAWARRGDTHDANHMRTPVKQGVEAGGGRRHQPAVEPETSLASAAARFSASSTENLSHVISASGELAAGICPCQEGRTSLRLKGHRRP
jgi:hypothetical protein